MKTVCSECANCFFYNDYMYCAGGESGTALADAIVSGDDSEIFTQWLMDHAISYDPDNCPMFIPTDTYDSETEDDSDEGDANDDADRI
jgi:hypothetical protein